MAVKTVNTEVTTTLTIEFINDEDVTVKVNADQTPVLKIYKDDTLFFTREGNDVSNDVTGVYYATWTPEETGEYEAVWTFLVSAIEYSQAEAIFVLDENGAGVDPDDPTPDVGEANTCLITGTFISSDGNYMPGVVVKFSPITAQKRHNDFGFVAGDVTTKSDDLGRIAFNVVRGLFGMLSITHVGVARRVTIPDEETIDIFSLTAEAPDTFEVQTPEFYTLPRRS